MYLPLSARFILSWGRASGERGLHVALAWQLQPKYDKRPTCNELNPV